MYSYNLGHNILQFYNVLIQIRLTTSKAKRDIQYCKLGMRVASRVAKRRMTQDLRKKGNIRKISNLGGDIVEPNAQSPLHKTNSGNSSEKTRKSRYQTFVALSSFAGFFYFAPNILQRIVDLMTSHQFRQISSCSNSKI